jgi:hypothetical protein
MALTNDRVFQMRVTEEFLRSIDDWRRQQPDLPSRAEAIRRLTEAGLGKAPVSAPPGGSNPGRARKPASAKTAAPRAKKPTAPDRKASPSSSKEAQIRALREQGADET